MTEAVVTTETESETATEAKVENEIVTETEAVTETETEEPVLFRVKVTNSNGAYLTDQPSSEVYSEYFLVENGTEFDVLEVFENNHISIEHMPSGIDTMTIFVHRDEFEEKEQDVIAGIHRAVEPDFLELESDLALIAVVGRGMRATRGTSGRIFAALAHANVNVKMIDQGSSELNIIIGVRSHDFDAAINAVYDIFVNTIV